MKQIIVMSFLLLSINFAYSDCTIFINKKISNSYPKLITSIKDALIKKGYSPKISIKTQIGNNKLYLEFKQQMEDKYLFPACLLSAKVKKTKDDYPGSKDLVIYKYSTKRSVPRLTFEGNRRCLLGVRDLFQFIKKCK